MTIIKSFTKTFKSEYFYGSTCKVQLRSNILKFTFGDGDGKSFNINSNKFLADASFYLETNSTYYLTEKVMEYIKGKIAKKNCI
jgi:hypothetical protein